MRSLILIGMISMLSACGDNPFNDETKIPDTDYAQIRIEMDRCAHIEEGSFLATMRFSPKMKCLNHLKERIVHTGKASPEMYR